MLANGIKIFFKKLHDDAIIPNYNHDGDAGCDLRVVEDYIINPGKRILCRTGFSIAIPDGFEAQIRPRSGLAWKKGLTVVNSPGTIDAGYRGEIKVALINLGDGDIFIKKGDAVAQMKFASAYRGYFVETEQLPPAVRGDGGFGSTGR